MTMRESRAVLANGLKTAMRITGTYADASVGTNTVTWTRQALLELLAEAHDAVLTCPHEGCAYCYTIEKETT